MNISKKKCGVFIALCTLILTTGIFMMASDKVFADDQYYQVVNALYDLSNENVASNGTYVGTRTIQNFVNLMYYAFNAEYFTKGYINGYLANDKVNIILAVDKTEFENINSNELVEAWVCSSTYGNTLNWYREEQYVNNYTLAGNFYYYEDYFSWGSNYYDKSVTFPLFNSKEECLSALGYITQENTEYNYNSDLGSLQNVYFRQVYDENNNSSQIEIIYDQYTSTGVNLNNNGYGVTTQIARKDPVNNDVQISNTIAKLQEDSQKRMLLLLGLPLSGIRWSDISDTQDSTDYFFPDNSSTGSDNDNYNELVKYDILLRPYYFDGLNYYYGDTTVIENVDVNKIGTRMMKSFDETNNNDSVDLNYTVVKNTDYNFTWNTNSISYNEYNNYNITNEDVVYNYTVNSDNSTEINNIGYSTTNIYNYDADNPSFNFNDFDITQQDVINTVKSFKEVWSAIIYFVPHVLGLFAYLPTWTLALVSGCFIILAGVCVVKFVAPLL